MLVNEPMPKRMKDVLVHVGTYFCCWKYHSLFRYFTHSGHKLRAFPGTVARSESRRLLTFQVIVPSKRSGRVTEPVLAPQPASLRIPEMNRRLCGSLSKPSGWTFYKNATLSSCCPALAPNIPSCVGLYSVLEHRSQSVSSWSGYYCWNLMLLSLNLWDSVEGPVHPASSVECHVILTGNWCFSYSDGFLKNW